MIVFDLDGTLADCEHRRHFVDWRKALETDEYFVDGYEEDCPVYLRHKITKEKWKPDWDAFYEACDRDEPIDSVIHILLGMYCMDSDVQIWSGRSESVREKTIAWLDDEISLPHIEESRNWNFNDMLKMRPIGNTEPDQVLKGRWLDEALASGNTIDYVFDDRPKMIHFWRSRGIFCFNVNQTGEEF